MNLDQKIDLNTLFDLVAAPLLVTDARGRILAMNQAAELLTGTSAASVEGSDLWQGLCHPEDADRVEALYSSRDPIPRQMPFIWRHADGERLPVVCQTRTDPAGTIVYTVQTATSSGLPPHLQDSYLLRLVEAMQHGIAIEDADGRLVYVNDALCIMLGAQRRSLMGRPLTDWLESETISGDEVQPAGGSNERVFRRADGSLCTTIAASTPIVGLNGESQGLFSILTDISAHKTLEAELLQSNEDLNAFAHTVAHDLKNPLSVLVGFATLLEEAFIEMSEAELREYLTTVGQTAEKMINIINELLLLAEMHHEEVELMRLNMPNIANESLKSLRRTVELYGAQLTMIEPDKWPVVLGKPVWIESVWMNYISNAIKYGGQPPVIELGVDVLPDGRVRFYVRDNGKGIPPEKLNRLFIPFERLEQARAEGHGLGLSIVQRILKKLGGEVGVESVVGKGSTFFFILPRP